MKYKVTINELIDEEGKAYPTSKEVFEQIIEDLDVVAIICAANGLVPQRKE